MTPNCCMVHNHDYIIIVQDLACRTEQVYGLAAVMFQAAQAEDSTISDTAEKVAQLEYENRQLREILQFSYSIRSTEDKHDD